MMKYICGNELISTHFEVKQFLALDRLHHLDTFDPAHDDNASHLGMNGPKIEESTSTWNGWRRGVFKKYKPIQYDESLLT